MKNESISLDIEVTLTQEDLQETAGKITKLDGEIDEMERDMENLKMSLSAIKKEIDDLDSRRRKLSREYVKGKALRTFSAYYIDTENSRIYYEVGSNRILKEEPLPVAQEMF
jgi:chromosome segregation ATPase